MHLISKNVDCQWVSAKEKHHLGKEIKYTSEVVGCYFK